MPLSNPLSAYYLTPDFLESQRRATGGNDNAIAELIARKDANFARKLERVKEDSRHYTNPEKLITGLLNHAIYGDAKFQPPRLNTFGLPAETTLEGGFTQQQIAESGFLGGPGKAIYNLGLGLGRTIKDVAGLGLAALETPFSEEKGREVAGIVKTLGGAGTRFLAGAGETAFEKVTGKQVPEFSPEGRTIPVEETKSQEVFNKGMQFLKENFGGPEEIVKTLVENPNRIFLALSAFTRADPRSVVSGIVRETSADIAGGTAGILEESAISSQLATRQLFVRGLVRQPQTKAVKEAQVARTKETGKGLLKKSEIQPSPAELRAEEAVMMLPKISPKNTFQGNYNAIHDALGVEAESLGARLRNNDFFISKKEVISRLRQAREDLTSHPLIVGDAAKTADRLIAKAEQFVNDAEGKGSAILEVRKNYDRWAEIQKPKLFDQQFENALSTANRAVRDTLNDIVKEGAKNVAVEDSLKFQSALYTAMDNITPKAAIEVDSAIGRIVQNVNNTVGRVRAGTFGVGAAGTAGAIYLAPQIVAATAALAGTGFLMYRAGKLIVSPSAKFAAAKLLRVLESALRLQPEIESQLLPLIEQVKPLSEGKIPSESLFREKRLMGLKGLPEEFSPINPVPPQGGTSLSPQFQLQIKKSASSTTLPKKSAPIKSGEMGENRLAGLKTIPKELEPLAAEARKYKSAEEFAEIFRGSPLDGDTIHNLIVESVKKSGKKFMGNKSSTQSRLIKEFGKRAEKLYDLQKKQTILIERMKNGGMSQPFSNVMATEDIQKLIEFYNQVTKSP